jgi:polysaccharide pyruvyl transferase WcaK-like protein
MEVILGYLRDVRPDAVIDAMTGGAERIRARHGIDAIPLTWYENYEHLALGRRAGVLRVLGKGIDAIRTVSWVRRHDVVIVPGAGVLETTLPMRAWGFPYALFLLCASGRLTGTKVALVSVGASTINQRVTRWLSDSTARLASYRSYRDSQSREVMRQRGIDTSGDQVYPDLVYGVPIPPPNPGDPRIVGVGVMAYYGSSDDRPHADQMHASYVEKMTSFVRWLVDSDHTVRLFGGDDKFDGDVARRVAEAVQRDRPGLDPSRLVTEPMSSYAELLRGMSGVGLVVATRYHNVMCALKLSKPTIALGYSEKFVSLMADMGLAEFTQFTRELDVDQLIEQFQELESRREQLRETMAQRNAAHVQALDRQFAELAARILPPAAAGGRLARGDVR